MSKTEGNVIAPETIIKKYGAEVLRLWVAGEDYRDDIRISEEILKRLSEAYRRVRNTFRYILGNLYDFTPERETVPYGELDELDRLTLHRLTVLTETVKSAYKKYEFHKVYHSVHNYCNQDLSAFYLDAIKDRLYTAKADSQERRAAQTTIYHVLDHLLRLFAPVLIFTTEEAWQVMPGRDETSVHLAAMATPPVEWLNNELAKSWEGLLEIKAEASKALEGARKAKLIGHPLDAAVTISYPPLLEESLKGRESALKEALVVSMVKLSSEASKASENPLSAEKKFTLESTHIADLSITVEKAAGDKCERCWHYSTSVGEDESAPTICERCRKALEK